ncbi:hypothetical protein GMES_3991 [Paraglaciecola mesophila KMM 241]|uniref:Uncharacterized protein n=1 Tax=Paraglaciecola mesophila KMM 241 TaxID=1128912 RepID=K6Y099_9ALTE|nr:hypothetical protein GMES_3991 [Paraglaciecola mesophila KMM 241]
MLLSRADCDEKSAVKLSVERRRTSVRNPYQISSKVFH